MRFRVGGSINFEFLGYLCGLPAFTKARTALLRLRFSGSPILLLIQVIRMLPPSKRAERRQVRGSSLETVNPHSAYDLGIQGNGMQLRNVGLGKYIMAYRVYSPLLPRDIRRMTVKIHSAFF